MITKLSFNNFRGFRNLVIEPVKAVNLLMGGNNSGKTSVLEGIYFLLADYSKTLAQFPQALRSSQSGGSVDDFKNFWMCFFYDQNPKEPLTVSAHLRDGQNIALSITERPDHFEGLREAGNKKSRITFMSGGLGIVEFSKEGVPKVCILSVRPTNPVEDAELYNEAALQKEGEARIEQLMKLVEPRLQRLRYSKLPGTSSPLVYADIGMRSFLPSTQMGHAFSRVLHIYAQTLVSKAEVFLIDEIENGIHHEVLPLFWKGLFELSKSEGVQIFATTHSAECIRAAHEASKGNGGYDFALHRLQREKGEIRAVTHDQGMIEAAMKTDLELR